MESGNVKELTMCYNTTQLLKPVVVCLIPKKHGIYDMILCCNEACFLSIKVHVYGIQYPSQYPSSCVLFNDASKEVFSALSKLDIHFPIASSTPF